MHTHASTLDFLIVGAYIVIFCALWRTTAYHLSAKGSPWGDAMLVVL